MQPLSARPLLAALLMSLVSVSVSAQEAPAPEVAVVEAPAAPAPASVFVAEGGAVIARDAAGQERWRHQVTTIDAAVLRGPVQLGSRVMYCAQSFLWETDVVSGVVARRHMLAARCDGLEAAGEAVRVKLKADGDGQWGWSEEVSITPGQPVVLRFSDRVMGAMLLRGQASRVLEAAVPGYGQGSVTERRAALAAPGAAEAVERAQLELARRAQQDPTNPWFQAVRATALAAQGREQEARLLALPALERLDPAYHHELVAASMEVDAVDAALAGRLFELGLKHALEQGYEPELASSLIHVIVHFGSIGKLELDPSRPEELARMDRLGERLYAYAPRAEMIATFYAGLAEAQRAGGDAARAEVWEARAHDERAQSTFGVASTDARRAGAGLTVLLALLSLFPLALAIKSARTMGASFVGDVSAVVRYNPVSRWGRGELVGMLCMFPLMHLVALRVAAGVATIALLASAPVSLASGELGSRGSLKFVEGGAGSPGGALLVGMHQHRAGMLAEAEASYQRSGLAQAKNNLGVLRAEQGDEAGARALWGEVAATVPEAAHNLGQPASGERVERAARLGVKRPLLALPEQADWDGFWAARMAGDPERAGDPVSSIFRLANMAGQIADEDTSMASDALVFNVLGWLLVVCGVVALATAWSTRELRYKRWHKGGWAIGHLVPGMARQWGPLGPLYTTLLLVALLSATSMQSGGGPSILDNIAAPSFHKYYGVSGQLSPSHLAPLVTLAGLWWVIWLVGVAISVALELWRPDPARGGSQGG